MKEEYLLLVAIIMPDGKRRKKQVSLSADNDLVAKERANSELACIMESHGDVGSKFRAKFYKEISLE